MAIIKLTASCKINVKAKYSDLANGIRRSYIFVLILATNTMYVARAQPSNCDLEIFYLKLRWNYIATCMGVVGVHHKNSHSSTNVAKHTYVLLLIKLLSG